MNRGDFTEKIKKFLASDWFTVILLVSAVGIVFSGAEIIGSVAFVLIFGVTMALTDDWMPLLQIIMFTTCFAIRCKNSFRWPAKRWVSRRSSLSSTAAPMPARSPTPTPTAPPFPDGSVSSALPKAAPISRMSIAIFPTCFSISVFLSGLF